jgi:Sulfotransferase family
VSDAAPIVIGALGGSGTRVLAEALIDSGVDLGSEFNRARDNLVFTALFKRPRWLSGAGDAEIHRQLDTFARYMQGRRRGPGDYARLVRSVVDHDPALGMRESAARVVPAARHRPGGRLAAGQPWGWKEPNSHVFLPPLIDHFADLRFVYVARHGLDMAFTRNKTQLHMWGPRFGVPAPADAAAEPGSQVDYWIAATRRAVELGETRLGDRFLFLRYDDLCRAPAAELRRLLEFAALPHDDAHVAHLAAGVRSPDSLGRWRAHGAGSFTPEQVAAVESFGFES